MGTLRIRVSDTFNNSASKEIPFSKDTTPPSITVVSVENGIITEDGTIYIMPPNTTIILNVRDNVALKELVYRIDNQQEQRVALQGKEATIRITIPWE